MAVIVSFATPKGIGSIHSPHIGAVRAREDITVPGSTTAAAQNGEIAVIANGEASIVAAAFGTTPDAAATAETTATSAGFGIPAGAVVMVPLKTGDKINIKALA